MDSTKLELVPTCPARIEELPPGEPMACRECGQPVTPGRQHPVDGEER